MTPPAPERPATPDDLRTALGPPTSYGVKLFEVVVLLFFLRLAARIIKTTAPSPFSLKLLRTLCVWAVTLPTTTQIESTFLCPYVLRCLLSWERTGHLIWRAIYLEGYSLGGLFFVCVILFFSCLRGWIPLLFATRWSTPFLWRS